MKIVPFHFYESLPPASGPSQSDQRSSQRDQSDHSYYQRLISLQIPNTDQTVREGRESRAGLTIKTKETSQEPRFPLSAWDNDCDDYNNTSNL